MQTDGGAAHSFTDGGGRGICVGVTFLLSSLGSLPRALANVREAAYLPLVQLTPTIMPWRNFCLRASRGCY